MSRTSSGRRPAAANAPRADCQDCAALLRAATYGHLDVVERLLSWPVNAPRADCQDGQALIWAAAQGRLNVVERLLSWSARRLSGWGGLGSGGIAWASQRRGTASVVARERPSRRLSRWTSFGRSCETRASGCCQCDHVVHEFRSGQTPPRWLLIRV